MEDIEICFQPKKLQCQCINVCVKHPVECLQGKPTDRCHQNEAEESSMDIDMDNAVQSDGCYHNLELKRNIFIPDNICEGIFQQIIKQYPEQYINLFVDTSKCRLTSIDLSTSETKYPLQDSDLISKLFDHPLKEINLSGCKTLSPSLNSLQKCASTLQILDLSSVTGVRWCLILQNLKQLWRLNLQNTDIGYLHEHMKEIGNLKNLKWLDLSCTCINNEGLVELLPLSSSLTWLSLYNCEFVTDEENLLQLLPQLTSLVHLDLSKKPVSDNNTIQNEKNNRIVTTDVLKILAGLPKLLSLDISGSTGLTEDDLLPFLQRSEKLKFLGLSSTGLSFHRNLPAEKVTGEANEEQLLNSLEIYKNRQRYVSIALRKLFTLARLQSCDNVRRCLELIVNSMQIYPRSDSINIAATASIYHLSREQHVANSDKELRKKIVEVVLDSMSNLKNVLQLQKNCCLTLCNFKIPVELEFVLFRVADLLLEALRNHKDDYLRRIAIMLFNTIVCQNFENQKREIGYLGAVKTILNIIQEKLETRESDQLLETCWSSLWNMTDETPENCRDFLDFGGRRMFVKSLELYPNALELHRNIMGLMGNVGEVKELRSRLMTDEYINIFIGLLSDDTNRLEVSYNSCGLLSHILSDGEEAWTITSITRDECMLKIIECIDRWNLAAQRNINYRSFKPILRLLACVHAPAAQHWAVWALANLTKVYPHKYCKLIEQEGGLELINQILQNGDVYVRTRWLGQSVLENCANASKYDSNIV
ncbi:protein zer-1 homolog [Clytia hemisphaerica]|uniref:Protein zer-1 homolog-like C-terminal domain-containing protein n=1 Tax=Clytia hemisphaerica TaxID=252671 RepID=A0A7M6DL08_9CNID